MYASVLSLQSGRYHYKLQESAKMCAPVLKCHQLQGGFATWPPTGALPFGPPLGLRPQTPVIGSRSRARHTSPLPLLQSTSDAPSINEVLTLHNHKSPRAPTDELHGSRINRAQLSTLYLHEPWTACNAYNLYPLATCYFRLVSNYKKLDQLSQSNPEMLRVIEYFAKSFKVTQGHSKWHPGVGNVSIFHRNYVCIPYRFWDIQRQITV